MKIIAFKRSNSPHLHPQFITEYIDASFLESTAGYETMIEEHFLLEIGKNEERHQAHLEYLRDQEILSHQAEKEAQVAEFIQEKEDEREYKRFKAWQRHNGKK